MKKDEVLRDYLRNPHWLFWHPFQGAWNIGASAIFGKFGGLKILVLIDTLIRWGLVLYRRFRCVLSGSGLRLDPGTKPRVVYLDIGMHETGAQVAKVLKWFDKRVDLLVYGFEANPRHIRNLRQVFSVFSNVEIINMAVVGPGCQDEVVRLYLDGLSGKGDSLFDSRGEEYIEVPAVRVSQFLCEKGVDPTEQILVLRMNIEGAERFVIADIVASGLGCLIDGYYGMWDDVYKIDTESGKAFLRELKRAKIHTLPFNDRDLRAPFSRMREAAVRFDIETSILRGIREKRETISC